MSTHFDMRMLWPLEHATACSGLPSPPGARDRPATGPLYALAHAFFGLGGALNGGRAEGGQVHMSVLSILKTPPLLLAYCTPIALWYLLTFQTSINRI